jgi:dUTP pyrophosphatase
MSAMVTIAFLRLPHGADLPLPAYESAGAAGMDLRAALGEGEVLELAPGAREMVPTGLGLQLPEGFEAQVRPRSGLAAKNGVTVLNAPGTIDSDIHATCVVWGKSSLRAYFHAMEAWVVADLLFAMR